MSVNKFIGIIPARYASTRFPGKPLVDILGKTMIQRVYEQAKKSNRLERVIVATDNELIYKTVQDFGGEVLMTSAEHPSGTDRCAEVSEQLGLSNDSKTVIINIQGDEPFIDPTQIDLLCSCFNQDAVNIATLVRKFSNTEDVASANTIKVALAKSGKALYFSRAVIPFDREAGLGFDFNNFHQHIGIYAYRAQTLGALTKLEPSFLENTEKLEQLRWLENGYEIFTSLSNHESWSVDTPEDLKKMLQRLQ
jgi:3-deoxy-manno-octulosonate cytidylyltransferase (CMP-KDO synthetase)